MPNSKQNLTPEQIKKEFKEIKKLRDKIATMGNTEQYHSGAEILKQKIKDFLYSEFVPVLNKNQFLELCDLISSHRPVEPWSFLVTVSIRKKTKGLATLKRAKAGRY